MYVRAQSMNTHKMISSLK